MKAAQSLIIKIIWLVFALFWLGTITLSLKKFNILFIAVPIILLIVLAVYLTRHRSLHISSRIILASLILLVLVPRIYWISNINLIPISDFETYYRLASLLSKGMIGYIEYISLFSHVISYPLVLSWIFRITGPSLISAEVVNILFALGTVLMIYWIVSRIVNPMAGWFSAALIALWPSQILFTTLVSTEAIFTFLQITCLAVLVYTMDRKNLRQRFLSFAALGLSLALANAIRPQAIVLLFGIVIYTLFFSSTTLRSGWQHRIAFVLICSVSFFLISFLIDHLIEKRIGLQTSSGLGYSLMVGVNLNSFGTYNQADVDTSYETYLSTGKNAKQWNSILIKTAIGRITSDPWKFIQIQIMKNYYIWQVDSYAVYWNLVSLNPSIGRPNILMENRERFKTISNSYYIVVLGLCVIASFLGLSRNEQGLALVIVIWVFGFILGFVFLEVQNRYHYHVLPLFAILAGCSLAWWRAFLNTNNVRNIQLFRQHGSPSQ